MSSSQLSPQYQHSMLPRGSECTPRTTHQQTHGCTGTQLAGLCFVRPVTQNNSSPVLES